MRVRDLKVNDWKELKKTASQAWHFTYKNVLDTKFIDEFIEDNYSKKATKEAVDWAHNNEGRNIVISDNKKIVGYATVGKDEDKWRLWRIYLLPDKIGKGFGSMLLNEVEKFLQNKKSKKYFCYVHKDNKLGINFYKKKGFKHLKKKDIEDEWYMEKNLITN